jgi:hypothetical protein
LYSGSSKLNAPGCAISRNAGSRTDHGESGTPADLFLRVGPFWGEASFAESHLSFERADEKWYQ